MESAASNGVTAVRLAVIEQRLTVAEREVKELEDRMVRLAASHARLEGQFREDKAVKDRAAEIVIENAQNNSEFWRLRSTKIGIVIGLCSVVLMTASAVLSFVTVVH